MDYKILVTADAEADLENFMLYRIENEVVIIDNIFMSYKIMKIIYYKGKKPQIYRFLWFFNESQKF